LGRVRRGCPMTEPNTVHGPYDTAAQARADAAELTAAIHAADPGRGPMTDQVRSARHQARADYLTRALTAAGVELGAYDKRIATWLADWRPRRCRCSSAGSSAP